MGRDLKVQLGTRIPAEVREMAVEQATALGCSLNVYIERIIRADVGNRVLPPGDQTTVFDVPVEKDPGVDPDNMIADTARVTVIVPATGPPDPHPEVELKQFAADCSNATYHWRHNPDNPCNRCKGEI